MRHAAYGRGDPLVTVDASATAASPGEVLRPHLVEELAELLDLVLLLVRNDDAGLAEHLLRAADRGAHPQRPLAYPNLPIKKAVAVGVIEAPIRNRRWSGIPIIGLRFSNVMEREDYERFASFWDDPIVRKWNLWSYVDESHVAQSCRLALEADIQGADAFIIAAADTVMKRPSRDLMAEVFPGVPVKDGVAEHGTLLDIEKARRVLGYSPEFTWRELL